jgi:hypothetical protein
MHDKNASECVFVLFMPVAAQCYASLHFGQVANSSKWCSSGHRGPLGPLLLTASRQESKQDIAKQLAATGGNQPRTPKDKSIEKP